MPEGAHPTSPPPAVARPASPVGVRVAEARDAADIARIHNQGIEERSATFEIDPRHPEQIEAKIADPGQLLVVAERDGAVVGWAGVSRANDRCTQAGVGEYTIYVDRDTRGGGVGVPLLEGLAGEAERNGYWKLVGRIFTTNEPSLALARRCGFYDVGIHRRHGRLAGEWKDVLVVERLLGDAAQD
ncbi:MAG: N-acetyltransferase [Solirubrobacterales bacterium]|nr:N-acetyltransferase [Solirubrobacterales bacterium]